MPRIYLCGPGRAGKTALGNALVSSVVFPSLTAATHACVDVDVNGLVGPALAAPPAGQCQGGVMSVLAKDGTPMGEAAEVQSVSQFVRAAVGCSTQLGPDVGAVAFDATPTADRGSVDLTEVAAQPSDDGGAPAPHRRVFDAARGDVCVVVVREDTFATASGGKAVRRLMESFGVGPAPAVLASALFFVNMAAVRPPSGNGSDEGRAAAVPSARRMSGSASPADDARVLLSNRLGVEVSRVFAGDARVALAVALAGAEGSTEAVDQLRTAICSRLPTPRRFGEAAPPLYPTAQQSPSPLAPAHRIEVDGRFAVSADSAARPDRYSLKAMSERPALLASQSFGPDGASRSQQEARLPQASEEPRYRLKSVDSPSRAAVLLAEQSQFTPKTVAV